MNAYILSIGFGFIICFVFVVGGACFEGAHHIPLLAFLGSEGMMWDAMTGKLIPHPLN